MEMYLTRIKYLLRSKANVFWAFFYPLILGTFFYLGFGSLSGNNSFKSIDLFIANDYANIEFVEIMKDLEYDDGIKLFNVNTSYTKKELGDYFADNKINNYIFMENDEIIYQISENGIIETIVKNVIDEYIQMNTFYQNVIENHPDKLDEITKSLSKQVSYLVEKTTGTNPKANKLIIYFYSLIAMACTFGSFWGISLVRDIQADQSPLAARVNITPTHKLKVILTYTLAAITIHFLGNLILIGYLKYILKIEFANNLILIILTSFIGTISGIALGSFLSSIIKGSPAKKEGFITTISLVLSFFSGLMNVDVKYNISKNIPILSYINPTSLLTDCFYSLYYYNDIGKYFLNLGLLSFISIILVFMTYFQMRGHTYDSI